MNIKQSLMGFAILVAGTANASTVFNPEVNANGTLENVDFFYLFIPSEYVLGLFDAGDTGFGTPLLVNTGNQVSFDPAVPGAPSYGARNDNTGASIPITATRGNSAAFILGLKGAAGGWLADSGAVDISGGTGTAFNVSFQSAPGQVLGVDMILAPVPVPAAVWLFGSGILGLAAISRRRKTNSASNAAQGVPVHCHE